MRGGLDDALDKLARRDELRRRAAGESPGTPPEVTELVEAIAGVVSRHPNLNVTVGVEGAGDPTLLHFAFDDGVVQVNADHSVAARAGAETPAKHADFEIVEVEVEEPPAPAYPTGSHDDQDRFGPTDFEYPEPPTAERPFVPAPQAPVSPAHYYDHRPGETSRDDLAARLRQANGATQEQPGVDPARHAQHPFAATPPPPIPDPYASAPQHPYAPAPPPPVPPAYAEPPRPQPSAPPFAQQAAPTEPPHAAAPPASGQPYAPPPPASAPPYAPPPASAPPHAPPPTSGPPYAPPPASAPPYAPPPASGPPYAASQPQPASVPPFAAAQAQPASVPPFAAPHAEPQPGFPEPLAQPIPLQVERPEDTEMAARRLAAMLRDDPTLLDNPPG